MLKVNKAMVSLLAVFVCAAIFLFPKLNALYLFLALAGLVTILIRKYAKDDARFLTIMMICIVATRLFLSLVVMEARGEKLTQDEGLYSKKAIIKIYEGKGVHDFEERFAEFFGGDFDMVNREYGYNVYTGLLSRFYYLFGYQIQAARLINAFLNILTFLLMFYTAKELFGPGTAKLSSAIFAFFPSVSLWSVSIGTDTMAFLCISAYLFSLVRVLKKFSFIWVVLMAASLFALMSFRGYAVSILVFVTLFGALCVLLKRMTMTGRVMLGLLAGLYILILFNTQALPVIEAEFSSGLRRVVIRQGGFATIDEGGYLIYPRHSYEDYTCGPLELARAYAKGMAHVLFSPFPWKINSKLQLAACPQAILLYFMFPVAIYGFYLGFRKDRLSTALIFMYCFLFFSTLALVQGNIGGLFRHRDMALPFTLIYFAAGLRAMLGRSGAEVSRSKEGAG